jgi:hypothetical protein
MVVQFPRILNKLLRLELFPRFVGGQLVLYKPVIGLVDDREAGEGRVKG